MFADGRRGKANCSSIKNTPKHESKQFTLKANIDAKENQNLIDDFDNKSDLSEFITDKPLDRKTTEDLLSYLLKQQERTRNKMAILLVGFVGASLFGNFAPMLLITFKPDMDVNKIKKVMPDSMTSQMTTLLGITLTHYFTKKRDG